MKVVATNRKAKRNYHIIETYDAGLVLEGNEAKSMRQRGCSIEESFGRIEAGEVFLYNMHIPEFEKSSYFKSDPKRRRKLLLHKAEIKKLIGVVAQRHFTLIPLKAYLNDRGFAKLEIALAKGRRVFDKRRKLKEEIIKRETERTLKRYRKKYR